MQETDELGPGFDWLIPIAAGVSQLLQIEGALEHFRAHVLTWAERQSEVEEQIHHREKERLRLFDGSKWAVGAKPESRPGDDWYLIHRRCFRTIEVIFPAECPAELESLIRTLARKTPDTFSANPTEAEPGTKQLVISAMFATWIPPELSPSRDPEETFPLPLTHRPLQEDERFALAAAIHDLAMRGVEKIDPWNRLTGVDEFCAALKRGYGHYARLKEQILLLAPDYAASIRSIIETLKGDLELALGLRFSDRERRILQVLWKNKVVRLEDGLSREKLARQAEGGASIDMIRESVARLKRDGFLDVKKGPGGGLWLTSKGRVVCHKMFSGKGL